MIIFIFIYLFFWKVTGRFPKDTKKPTREVSEAVVFKNDVDFNRVLVFRDAAGWLAIEEILEH